ncbi:MAG: hypothetical protein RI918_1897, partial [Pseudomonadota bacterium]
MDPFLFCVHHEDNFPKGNEVMGPAVPLSGRNMGDDFIIKDGFATIALDNIKQGANIHRKGCDKQQGATVVAANTIVDATVISMAASVGQVMLVVRKLP